MENIKAKSEQWKEAIAAELGVKSEDYSAFELMYSFLEDSDYYDEELYKSIKRKYELDNTITDDDFRHVIRGVVLNTFNLCKEVFKKIPSSMSQKFEYLKQAKVWNKYIGYLQEHGEKAVVRVVRTMDNSIVEVNVQTTEVKAELLYWHKDRIFIMNFVSELEEDIDAPLSIQEL